MFFHSPKLLTVGYASLTQAGFADRIVYGNENKDQLGWRDQLTKCIDSFGVADAVDDEGLPRLPIHLHEDRPTKLFPALVNQGRPDML
jgi:hypothetical protein